LKRPLQKIPLCELLVTRKLADSGRAAQAMVLAGQVVVVDQRVDKPHVLVSQDALVRVKAQRRFVGRGGQKLYDTVMANNLHTMFEGKIIYDIGASTGGFTDCALVLGAKQVVAIDVGKNLLDFRLRADPRVLVYEQTHVRDLDLEGLPEADVLLADISFNSLSRLAPAIVRLVKPHAHLFLLLKPQFEVERRDVPEGGVVTDPGIAQAMMKRVCAVFSALGMTPLGSYQSLVKGRKGNQEYFLYFKCCS
jgi:23S rRNA (cytidine1920-2'-O)/16S rRNA (cytidine1409-2'-O)-methyltransferase